MNLRPLVAGRIGLTLVAGMSLVCTNPAKVTAQQPAPEVKAALLEMFDAGLSVGRGNLEQAYNKLAELRQLRPEDPRIEHAWGVILLRQLKWDQAAAQFGRARETGESVYLPAWRAHAWVLLMTDEEQAARDELIAISHYLAEQGQKDLAPEEIATAAWLGQVIQSLEITAPAGQRDEANRLHGRVQFPLEGKLLESFALGLQSADLRGAALALQADRRGKQRVGGQRDHQQEALQKLDEKLSEARRQKEDAEKTAIDAKQALDEALEQADKELARLEKDYKFIQSQVGLLLRSKEFVSQQLTLLELNSSRDGARPSLVEQSQQAELRRTLARYLNEYLLLRQQAVNVAQSAQQVAQQKVVAIQQFQQLTGQTVKKTAELDRWTQRLQSEKQEVAQAADDDDDAQPADQPQKPAAGKNAQRRAPARISFRSFVDLDPTEERDRILTAFGVAQQPEKEAQP